MSKKAFVSMFLATLLLSSCSVKEIYSVEALEEPVIEYNKFTHYNEMNEIRAYINSLTEFNSELTALSLKGNTTNMSISPLSMYMTLALASETGNNSTRQEILDAFNVSYADLKKYTNYIYSLSSKNSDNCKELLTNSIWIDASSNPIENELLVLKDNYKCFSYKADFNNNLVDAKKAVRQFVKKNTNGLIDQEFAIDSSTKYLLMNTLYLKTIWNDYGDDLPFTKTEYQFKNSDSTIKSTKLLEGYYFDGLALEYDNYKIFYTKTEAGYKIKFIVPNDNVSINDVMTKDVIANVISNNSYVTRKDNYVYHTRCLFPEYEAKCHLDAKSILNQMGINSMFKANADFTNLTTDEVFCSGVFHDTLLKVNKKGIEGAAVTYIPMAGASAPEEVIHEYHDFIVDKAFGFVLTDSNNIVLFSGVVNKL